MRRRGGSVQPVKGRPANRPKGRKVSTAASSIADAQSTRFADELKAANEQFTATANILKVIASSPSEVQPVFEAIATTANRLIGGFSTAVCRVIDDVVHLVAFTPTNPESDAALKAAFPLHRSELPQVPLIQDGETVQIADSESADPQTRRLGRARGWRSVAFTPLMNQGASIGFIACTRRETGVLADHHVQLLRTFADQAVIAIENARLFNEVQARTRDLQESLQQQTATADVLKVISRSAFDLHTVLDALLASACRLCEAEIGTIRYQEGGDYRLAATFGCKPEWIDHLSHYPAKPDRGSIFGRTIVDARTVHFPDVLADPDFQRQSAQNLMGFRAALGVPLVRDGQTFGVISLLRLAVGPFSEKQIELIQTFADQAVIAIENVRLITETREALERQTATAEVLQVINSSPGDLTPVFDAILEKAHNFCGVSHGSLQLYDGEKFRAVAVHGISEAFANRLRQGFVPGPNHPSQPLLKSARFAQVPDCNEADDPLVRAAFELAGIRTVLFIPLRKDGILLGQIAAARREARPFTEKEIALLENFAAQAVIAIENARLLTETREALERQTATAEVLQVINSSPGELAPVFDAILEKAHRLCAVALGSCFMTARSSVPSRCADFRRRSRLACAKALSRVRTCRTVACWRARVLPKSWIGPRSTIRLPVPRSTLVSGPVCSSPCAGRECCSATSLLPERR
jgi:two-component system NtrC family sensor kinase